LEMLDPFYSDCPTIAPDPTIFPPSLVQFSSATSSSYARFHLNPMLGSDWLALGKTNLQCPAAFDLGKPISCTEFFYPPIPNSHLIHLPRTSRRPLQAKDLIPWCYLVTPLLLVFYDHRRIFSSPDAFDYSEPVLSWILDP